MRPKIRIRTIVVPQEGDFDDFVARRGPLSRAHFLLLRQVAWAVAQRTCVELREIFSRSQSRRAVDARSLCCLVARYSDPSLSWPILGRFFYRDPSTLLDTTRKYEAYLRAESKQAKVAALAQIAVFRQELACR